MEKRNTVEMDCEIEMMGDIRIRGKRARHLYRRAKTEERYGSDQESRTLTKAAEAGSGTEQFTHVGRLTAPRICTVF
jgi:hypothetical protein